MSEPHGYYEQSYPPSIWDGGGGGKATGATAGKPGYWTPEGSTPPPNIEAAATVVPNPAWTWIAGQSVELGNGDPIWWNGVAWVAGVCPPTVGTAGTPGTWSGGTPPSSFNDISYRLGTGDIITASPATAWTTGQYVEAGIERVHWDGAAWASEAAPLQADDDGEDLEA